GGGQSVDQAGAIRSNHAENEGQAHRHTAYGAGDRLSSPAAVGRGFAMSSGLRGGRVAEQRLFDEAVGYLGHVVGREMGIVGIGDAQPLRNAVELVYAAHLGGGLLDAAPVEVAVAQGGVREKGRRGQGGDELVEVEGHLVRIQVVAVADGGEVAVAGPALQVALVVIVEG